MIFWTCKDILFYLGAIQICSVDIDQKQSSNNHKSKNVNVPNSAHLDPIKCNFFRILSEGATTRTYSVKQRLRSCFMIISWVFLAYTDTSNLNCSKVKKNIFTSEKKINPSSILDILVHTFFSLSFGFLVKFSPPRAVFAGQKLSFHFFLSWQIGMITTHSGLIFGKFII